MKKYMRTSIIVGMLLGSAFSLMAAMIESEFENPPESARPGTNRFRPEATLP
jgi:hypothetical protein